MIRSLFMFMVSLSSLLAFESTNVQLLYSDGFKGDSFVYDTVDGKKTTLTFEHYRTFSLGDFYMFVDIMDGEKFNAAETEVYSEIAPRFSLSKLSSSDISFGFFKDFYIATQLNAGDDYRAYLLGLGVDIQMPGFNYVGLNIYYKNENIHEEDTYQITPVYQSKSYYNIHFEGFTDITSREINTQNQLLYNFKSLINTKEQIYVGVEWIYYDFSYKGSSANTSVLQGMLKYQF